MSSPAIVAASEPILKLLKEPVVPTVGIRPKVSFDDYHAWHAASNSRLSVLRRSPAHLKAYLEQGKDSQSLLTGRICHTAILEPDELSRRYLVAERCEAITKAKERCSKQGSIYSGAEGWRCGTHSSGIFTDPGVTIVSKGDMDLALKVRDSVSKHRAAALLKEGMRELSIAWDDRESGVRCKARLDHHSPALAGGAIVDIKTTTDASPRTFEKSIYNFGYHRQGALYVEGAKELGLGSEHFAIIAVEKEPPYAVAIYRLTEGALDAGAEQIRQLLSLYAQCVERDEWPGYSEEVQDAALPSWAWSQISDEVANQ